MTPDVLRRVLAACGGFLLAVLWFDFMFDVQVLAHDASESVPEGVLASIAAYYRRVTTEAYPMNRLVGLVMIATVAGSVWQLVRGPARPWVRLTTLLLALGPVSLAAVRVVPNAVRLGSRSDTLARQAELARAICYDHALCLAAMTAFVAIQLGAGAREPRA